MTSWILYRRVIEVQMQASVDPAAIAGMRLRDADPNDPVTNDAQRRLGAIQTASALFDADLDPTTPDASGFYGAGPVFSTGVAGIDAPELLGACAREQRGLKAQPVGNASSRGIEPSI